MDNKKKMTSKNESKTTNRSTGNHESFEERSEAAKKGWEHRRENMDSNDKK